MDYKFKTKDGSILRVFYNDLFIREDNYGTVSWFSKEKNRSVMKKVKKDENGKLYFTHNREKIFMENFEAYTPEEIIENIKNVCGEDLCHTLLKYGIDCFHVMIKTKPLWFLNFGNVKIGFDVSTSLDDPNENKWIEYKIVNDEDEYSPKNNYKFKLVPVNEKDYEIYPKERFYTDDFMSHLRRNDRIKVKKEKTTQQ